MRGVNGERFKGERCKSRLATSAGNFSVANESNTLGDKNNGVTGR